MSYQKTTGPLMANSHPGSYCGQDAYSDMLITEPQRERERVWAMTTEKNYVLIRGKSPAIRARDWKDPNIVFTPLGD
jgi:hypothetical protein